MKIKKKSLTKEKIKNIALTLFNEIDTLSITTNHIASKTKISTGNLYYHYKNKEDIIVDIYEDMSFKFDEFKSFEQILKSKNPLKELYVMYDLYGNLFWEYRFIMRDSAVLIALFPKFKELFLLHQIQRLDQIESVIHYFIEKNIFKSISQEEIKLRAKLNWFISAYWQVFTATSENVTKESIDEIKNVIFKINIYPFLTEEGEGLASELKC